MTNSEKVRAKTRELMAAIASPPKDALRFPFLNVTASAFYRDALFGWDAYFMGLRFAEDGDPQYLRHMVDNLLAYQGADGFVPNMITASTGPLDMGRQFHAQPLLCMAAARYAADSGDSEWLAARLPKLRRFLAHLEATTLHANGLFRWGLNWGSGIDNDILYQVFLPDSVIAPDMSAWMVMEYRAAARLCEQGGDHAGSAEYAAKAGQLADRVNELLWHEAESSYCALNLLSGSLQLGYPEELPGGFGRHAFQTCSNLLPLWAGVAPQERAAAMIRRYVLSPDHFLSRFGIRSLSASSPYYNNAHWGNPPRFTDHKRLTNSNWQGPVWMGITFMMFEALRHYGFTAEASDLAARATNTLAGSVDAIGTFSENYHAETGAPGYARDYASWNLLVDLMNQKIP